MSYNKQAELQSLIEKWGLNPPSDCICPDGWLPLLDALMLDLSKTGLDLKDGVRQVKQKFGGLRVYISGETEERHKLLAAAERKSLEICEDCGAPGKCVQRQRGYIQALCERCLQKP